MQAKYHRAWCNTPPKKSKIRSKNIIMGRAVIIHESFFPCLLPFARRSSRPNDLAFLDSIFLRVLPTMIMPFSSRRSFISQCLSLSRFYRCAASAPSTMISHGMYVKCTSINSILYVQICNLNYGHDEYFCIVLIILCARN